MCPDLAPEGKLAPAFWREAGFSPAEFLKGAARGGANPAGPS